MSSTRFVTTKKQVTIEENNYSDAEYSAIMDRFFAGQGV